MVFYSHNTALAFWVRRAVSRDASAYPEISFMPESRSSAFDASEIDERLAGCDQDECVHIMLATRDRQRAKARVFHHCVSAQLPQGSFRSVSENCAMASPELLFIQMGMEMNDVHQVAFGNLLCASFAPVNSEVDMRGFCEIEPLTNPHRIAAIASHIRHMKGVGNAKRNLNYVTANAASPREVVLAMLLTLPSSMGGFGFAKPELNGSIVLPPRTAQSFGRRSLRADMLWRAQKVAIEYDSDQWHTGTERITYDSRRRNLLKSMGYDVITVTNGEIKRRGDMERIANVLAAALGRRIRIRTQGFEEKRGRLTRTVLDPGFFAKLLDG